MLKISIVYEMRRTMKKSKFLMFGIVGFLLIIWVIGTVSMYSTFKKENKLSIEMVAFNSLTNEENTLIQVSPKDSIVKQIPLSDELKGSLDSNYTENQVYSVTFNNTETGTTGNLVVFVGLDKKTVLGKGFTGK